MTWGNKWNLGYIGAEKNLHRRKEDHTRWTHVVDGSGDDVASNAETEDKVAGDYEGASDETRETARRVTESLQPVDLLSDAARTGRRFRRRRRSGLRVHQSDGKTSQKAIHRVGQTQISALHNATQIGVKSTKTALCANVTDTVMILQITENVPCFSIMNSLVVAVRKPKCAIFFTETK